MYGEKLARMAEMCCTEREHAVAAEFDCRPACTKMAGRAVKMALDEDDEARDLQALLPFLIQILPIGLAAVLGRVVFPALVPALALIAFAFLLADQPTDDDSR